MIPSFSSKLRFRDLTEAEVLALAISSEEDDGRIYRNFASRLQHEYPSTSAMFMDMAAEEDRHRQSLIALYRIRFGPTIPLIRRAHVSGFYERKPEWLLENLSVARVREVIVEMEREARIFYEKAAARVSDAEVRRLLGNLAAAEAGHERRASELAATHLTEEAVAQEDHQARRQFILTWIQPGLAGLMDGSVSTLAPIFAAAFATGDTWNTFLVGLAASVGAGISMGFTEAASDDGELSGRGSPLKRGVASGVMTAIGGLGHALPYLIPDFRTATTLAVIVVFVELWSIAWIQNRFMKTPFWRAALQVVVGGGLVLAAGIVIGSG